MIPSSCRQAWRLQECCIATCCTPRFREPGSYPRGEPRGAEHRNAVHPVPAQVQARRPDQSAAPWAQRVRRHGEKEAAALSRYRRCRHGPKPLPPAAGEGVQREGAAGIPRSELPAGRVPMAGGKEPSER